MRRYDEEARLDALHRLNLLDTAPSESFDRITRMAGQIFGLPIAAVSLTDRDRQWFKSRVGISHWSIPRHKAPCAQVAETAETVLIPDLQENRCYDSSFLAEQGIRFYAGAPLTTRDGHSLGALCVLGTEPREASEEQMTALNDLAQMVMAQIELQHAFGRLDAVSGLPNRTQFLDDLADLGNDQPGHRRLAVLVDLARPEQLNSGVRVLGAAYLDQIVHEAVRNISAVLGSEHLAYHVAARQFAFLMPIGADVQDYIANELRSLLERFRSHGRDSFIMTPSVGVAPFVAGTTSPATVLRQAHSAAQDARSLPSMIGVYSSDVDAAHQRSFRLLQDFSRALESEDELSLAYQPRIDLASGRCTGAEALIRWEHAELGQVSPGEFTPIIEQTALAGPTTMWVLNTGLGQLARWRAAGLDLRLSLNVSASNLEDPQFAQWVQLHLLKHRIQADWIELEITESAIMADVTNAMRQLAALSDAGVHLAIDDFGTGHSSLAYLQRLPGKILKIDRSFVSDIDRGEREQTLIRSMISLARELGYRVVAEGVETANTSDWLVTMGCDEGQGFFYGRPMASTAFDSWFAAFASTHSPPLTAAA